MTSNSTRSATKFAAKLNGMDTPGPGGTLMRGDGIETVIIAGQATGLMTILARTGVPPRQVPGVSPDIDIASLSDLALHMAHEGRWNRGLDPLDDQGKAVREWNDLVEPRGG